jgi:hypothetical protein
MSQLMQQWSLIYGRKCTSQNKTYLRKAVTYPGVRFTRRAPAPPVVDLEAARVVELEVLQEEDEDSDTPPPSMQGAPCFDSPER